MYIGLQNFTGNMRCCEFAFFLSKNTSGSGKGLNTLNTGRLVGWLKKGKAPDAWVANILHL